MPDSTQRPDDEPEPSADPPSIGSGSVLEEPAPEDRDVGWGDAPSERDDEWYRRERPPHHG